MYTVLDSQPFLTPTQMRSTDPSEVLLQSANKLLTQSSATPVTQGKACNTFKGPIRNPVGGFGWPFKTNELLII